MLKRLQIVIRDSEGISRRKVEELISKGKIYVNGKRAKLGQQVDPGKDKILVNGKKIGGSLDFEYIIMNKPPGCITTRKDTHNRKTIFHLMPRKYKHLFPVGRLDYYSEGLLILTNDGDLTYKLTHPKHEVEKEYYVELQGELKDSEKAGIEKGLKTKVITSSPCKITIKTRKEGKTVLNIILHEGQKREIRRIFTVFKYEVLKLKRVRINNLKLGNLKKGKWEKINNKDLELLSKISQ